MDTCNLQCLVIQSTGDTGMLSLLPEVLFFHLGSSGTEVKIYIFGFFSIKSLVYDGKTCYILDTLFGLSVVVFRAMYSVTGSTLEEDKRAGVIHILPRNKETRCSMTSLTKCIKQIKEIQVKTAKVSIWTMFYWVDFIFYGVYLFINLIWLRVGLKRQNLLIQNLTGSELCRGNRTNCFVVRSWQDNGI